MPENLYNKANIIADSLAGEIPILAKPAQNIASQLVGFHAKKQAGSSDEFFQFRPYSSGESVANIDWRQSAKSDKAFVKQKEQQSPRRFQIFSLQSPRINWQFSPKSPNKNNIANLCALSIGFALLDIGESVVIAGQKKSTKSKSTLAQSLVNSIGEIPHEFPKGVSLIFHDGLCDLSLFADAFRRAQSAGNKIILGIIKDENEANFNFKGRTEFQSLEKNETILIENCDEIRGKYITAYQKHFNELEDLANKNKALIYNIFCGHDILKQIVPIWQNALLLDEVKL